MGPSIPERRGRWARRWRGFQPLPIQAQQPKTATPEPPAEPYASPIMEKPVFSREKSIGSAKRNTPTGNGTRLGIGRHPLAGDSRASRPSTPCPSLRTTGLDSPRSDEPSPEPSLAGRRPRLSRPLLRGAAPQPASLFSYSYGFFFWLFS